MTLENTIETLSFKYDGFHKDRLELESKVVSLRPGSIEYDLLEERARYVLGYIHPDDQMLLEWSSLNH